jgi:soluble lytic murein transglycosylase
MILTGLMILQSASGRRNGPLAGVALACALTLATPSLAVPMGSPGAGAARTLAGEAGARAIVLAAAEARLPRPRPDAEASHDSPLPRPRPDLADAPPRAEANFHGFRSDTAFRAALEALDAKRYGEARKLAAEHSDPLAAALVDWLIARADDSDLQASEVLAVLARHPDWPDADRLRLRAEQAFHADGPSHAAILAFYGEAPPITIGGRIALAGALRQAGREAEAAKLVRALWREEALAPGQAALLIARFGAELTRDDHLYRFRRLVLTRRTTDAVAEAQLLGLGYADLARAVIAVLERRSNGARLLRDVDPKLKQEPLYILARAWQLRRSGKPEEAANLLLKHPGDATLVGDAGVWWDERRDLSRVLLDRKKPELAYRIVAAGVPEKDGDRVEAAFHAGWYALRFLEDPARAEPHFRQLFEMATLPRTRARASYWLARTYAAQGQDTAARLAYGEAARFGGTFYGQLAREALGLQTTGLERPPAPSARDRIRFAEREASQAIRLFAAAGRGEDAYPFFRRLAETVETPGEAALLMSLARRIGQPRAGLNAVAIAEGRGLAVRSLPAPFLGVPAALPLPDPVDRALVYAVARQESAFNHEATSHAGARGLMQLMPGTARATARNARLPFSLQRLTSDPLYNATLGAEHLGELLERLDSSYVLTFVGYNAGPGRARDWVAAYGDPRGGRVDAVDWIERIPFDETRNYVQKVMENLQVYRSRIGYPLSLSADLVRGGPQS